MNKKLIDKDKFIIMLLCFVYTFLILYIPFRYEGLI